MTAFRIAAGLLALALGGCSALQTAKDIEDRADGKEQANVQSVGRFRELTADPARAQDQVVDKPWIVGKARPLAREVSLPPALRANVNTTLLYSDPSAGLVELAERIQTATGIPVTVEPDALLPRDMFLPRLADADAEARRMAGTDAAAERADTIVPGLVASSSGMQTAGPILPAGVSRTKPQLSGTSSPLAAVLDNIALRLGVWWRYDTQTGAIVFYRVESRTFVVRALVQATETSLELGLTGAGASGASGQFVSQSRSKYTTGESKQRAIEAVLAKITQLLSRSGRVVADDSATNSIVVTDSRDALDRVAAFLEPENRALTRRVRLVFEEITVQRDNLHQAGFDWKLLFDSAGRANTAAGDAPGGLLDTTKEAATLGATVGSGPFAGSGAVIRALSEIGTVLRHTSIPILALNRRPATYTVRETFQYVKDLQQTQSTSDSTAPTVTVTQDERTVGTFLTVVPDAQEDGQVLLTVSYDDTRLIGPLTKVEFGSSENPSFVQQSRIGGHGVVQQVELRPGSPVVIGGLEQTIDNATRRRLDRDAPILLGGSDAAEKQTLMTVLTVTAIPEDGF